MILTVTVTGIKKYEDGLDKLGLSLFDLTKSMSAIGAWLKDDYSDRSFATRGESVGAPWADLAPATQKQKSIKYREFSSMPLIRTGEMMKSFGFRPTPLSVTIDNSADYFKYHQSAAERSSNLPRRVMMALTERHILFITQAVGDDIKRKIAEAM